MAGYFEGEIRPELARYLVGDLEPVDPTALTRDATLKAAFLTGGVIEDQLDNYDLPEVGYRGVFAEPNAIRSTHPIPIGMFNGAIVESVINITTSNRHIIRTDQAQVPTVLPTISFPDTPAVIGIGATVRTPDGKYFASVSLNGPGRDNLPVLDDLRDHPDAVNRGMAEFYRTGFVRAVLIAALDRNEAELGLADDPAA